MKFHKIEGAGNDFIVTTEAFTPQASRIARLCDRHYGIGADGMIVLRPTLTGAPHQREQKWVWNFWNNDASSAAMCGNAARALAVWFRSFFPSENEFHWSGETGLIRSRYLSANSSEVSWTVSGKIQPLPDALTVELKSKLPEDVSAHFVDSGVPHVVLLRKGTWDRTLRTNVAPLIRFHAALGSAGANVTFVDSQQGTAVSFERGVDGETLACGSGALAAFLALESIPKSKIPPFRFPGGTLEVSRRGDGLWLKGPARIVFSGVWNEP